MSRLEKGDLLKRSEKFIHNVVSLLKDDLKRPKTIYENDLSRQLFRSVTSIGANMHEADVAISDKEFVSKLSIVLKESNETWYWMGLMNNEFVVLFDETLLDDLTQIVKIIKYVIGKLKN